MAPRKAIKTQKSQKKRVTASRGVASKASPEEKQRDALTGPSLGFPIAAVGASAGGLGAFTALLKALPLKPGLALVLIQHLEPNHESALVTLLSKATGIPVVEASDGIRVEANRIYVIPPNKIMTIRRGALRLAPRTAKSGLPRPIDEFSSALAEEYGSGAIGVLLSGTGSDGTDGLKAIKAAGGITFAEDPKDAQWPAMPMSAITAGAVDFVLPAKGIAAELVRIARHPYLVQVKETAEGDDLDAISFALRSETGVDFRLYKQPTFRRRVARRMALLHIGSLEKYTQIIKHDRQEAQALSDDVFIHVTSFFRNPECFEALRKRVISKWRGSRPGAEATFRVWIPGCSTGEEVYSTAMLVLEQLKEQAGRAKIQIFGTDIQERAAEHARAGIYSEAAVAGVSPARLKRFFVKVESGYQIQPFVRELCVFARHDLAKDPPFSRLDLICCRNVLIYMGPVLQKKVLSTFQYALKPGGFLMLGNSESIGGYSDTFASEDRKHRIFSRKPSMTAFHEMGAMQGHRDASPIGSSAGPQPQLEGQDAPGDLRKEAEGVLLEHYMPPALIVDGDLHIVYFQGDTSPYLAPATGQPSFHVLKMVRPEFVVDVRTAISSARKTGAACSREIGPAAADKGSSGTVRVEVRPFKRSNSSRKQHLIIVFQRIEGAKGGEHAKNGGRKLDAGMTGRLERELTAARQQLRVLITEHETAQEEMKAANEEILSSNEELQSTNEELETAKEELQSSNEELITLNEELQHRNNDLAVLTTDLNSLLVNLDIPVLVLDAGLRVRRFTPVAGQLLNLIPGDIGRPFSNIASNLEGADWAALLADVSVHGQPVEREVDDRSGHRYSLRIRPHKPNGRDVDGVVVFLIDIGAIHQALEEAKRSRDLANDMQERTDSIVNSLTARVAVVSTDGTILDTNDAWKQFAALNHDCPMARVAPLENYLDACRGGVASGYPDAEAALGGIRDVLEGRRHSFELEYPCGPTPERSWFLMTVAPFKGAKGGAVVTHLDITARKLAEVAALRSEATVRALLESSPQSVVAVSADGRIAFVNGHTSEMFGYVQEELLGQPLTMLVPVEARERHDVHLDAYFHGPMESRVMGLGMNLSGLRKDGSTFPVEIGLNSVETTSGKMAVAFVTDITQRRTLEQAQIHAAEVRAFAASLLKAQEEERGRVSRELHDEICQQLASLAFDIARLAAKPDSVANVRTRLQELRVRAVKASEEARHLAHELHPSFLEDLGLLASLRSLSEELATRVPGVAIEFKADAMEGSIAREAASCLYRIAQESLRNIEKHANAKHVSVALETRDRGLTLTIVDDGEGFDPAIVKGRGGLGLIGMEERARLVNGKLSIESKPGYGTRTVLEISLPEKAGA